LVFLCEQLHVFNTENNRCFYVSSLNIPFISVEKELRKYSFGVLGTVDKFGRSHSVGLIYAVSESSTPFRIYSITQMKTKKVKNIVVNLNVSFSVPCSRMVFKMVPPNCIQFQGTAEILAIDDQNANRAFECSYLLRMMLDKAFEVDTTALGEPCFICIKPDPIIHTYGIGLSIWQLYKHIENAGSKVKIPQNRL
jgi:nitroimidazol reductase NimA-like FMN-containing flavoprotein (pyridoxamine 5'-phosphate oxidase superfamily)